MSDRRTRELERAAAEGDVEAAAQLVAVKARLGEWAEPVHLDGGMWRTSKTIRQGACGQWKVDYPEGFEDYVVKLIAAAYYTSPNRTDGDEVSAAAEEQAVRVLAPRCILFVTDRTELVTCGACKRTRAFRGLPPPIVGKVHLLSDADEYYGHRSACGWLHVPLDNQTEVAEKVTCKRCKKTQPAWFWKGVGCG